MALVSGPIRFYFFVKKKLAHNGEHQSGTSKVGRNWRSLSGAALSLGAST
jgi:hypothetical protein